jgi:Family of unknown function (DUF5522)
MDESQDDADEAEEAEAGDGAAGRRVPTPQPLAERPLTQPHAERLSPDNSAFSEIIRAHAEALAAGADTYVDPPSGLTVLTAGYLARRGYCCESGCRHCPYVA